MIFIQPPIYWYIAISILATLTAWKLQVIGDNPIVYYICAIILVILAMIPAWKGVNRDEKIREESV